MAKIVSLPDGVEFDANEGETLLEAALRAALPLTHACGGRARCSTCRVWVLAGLEKCPLRTEAEQALAKRLGLGDEVRLACQLRPCGDLRVRRLVLDETDLMMSSQLDRSAATRVGEVREVTVFFSDIVGFTTIAETLPPYDVMYLLNRYFVQAGEIIERNGGYIDKFVGDGMMALFGVDGQEDAPIRAVNAALQTLAATDRMKPFMASMYALDFDIRIGLHHGEALLGSVGTLGHERLTAIGDVVNVASRVEGANKEAGTRLLISEALYRLVEDKVEVLDFVRTRLRGTSERITLYEIDRLKPEVEAALNERVLRGTERYAGPRLAARVRRGRACRRRAAHPRTRAMRRRRLSRPGRLRRLQQRLSARAPAVLRPEAAPRGASGQAAAAAERGDRGPSHRLPLARQLLRSADRRNPRLVPTAQ